MAAYGDTTGFEAWMSASGYVIPTGAPSAAALIQRGSDWVDGQFSKRFTGTPTGGISQERAWPRTGATAFGESIPDQTIPTAVIHASYAAAYQEALAPGLLATATSTESRIKRQKVDSIEVEFADPVPAPPLGVAPDPVLRLNAVEGLLAPLLRASSTVLGSFIRSVGA